MPGQEAQEDSLEEAKEVVAEVRADPGYEPPPTTAHPVVRCSVLYRRMIGVIIGLVI